MTLGLSLYAFTMLHVAISLIAIASGFVVASQLIGGRKSEPWTALFLAATILTSVTGFMFPVTVFTPALAFGVVSMIVLALAVFAWYQRRLAGSWRWIYVVTAIFALYLNVFVLVVQAFQKVPPLNALAPTGSEAPFLIAQLAVLAAFIWIGIRATRRFRPNGLMPA
ncbi:MAG: hypothetical protein AB7F76_04530 [Parvibaculaceae bacterium]